MEKEILSLPIYRCDRKKYRIELKKEKDKYLAFYKLEENRISLERMSQCFDKEKWYPWKYNEIVGWIEIRFNQSKMIGNYWYVKNRVSRLLKKKMFDCHGKVFEGFFHSYKSNEQISEVIIESVKCFYRENNELKNRHLDIEEAEFKIRATNWLEVINHLTKH